RPSRAAALPPWRIVTGQVLPRIAGPIIVQASFGAGGALLAQAGIEVLGLGVARRTPTWGGMVAEASNVIDQQPWLLVPSGVVIGLTILAFGVVGDAVRDTGGERVGPPPVHHRRARATGTVPIAPVDDSDRT